MPHSFTSQQINRLGNSLVYLAGGISEFNKTKVLKLLFILEESSIKKFGHPFFGFDFQIWKFGPVIQDVYIDLSEDTPTLLKDYIRLGEDGYVGIVDFNDDEFSDNDIFLLDKIIEFARHKNAGDLVEHTHGKNSLWKKAVIQFGLAEKFKTVYTSDKNIDFSLLFEENNFLKEKYESAVENIQFINHLKR